MKKTICLLLASLQLAGCTSMVPVPHDRGVFDPAVIRVGETISMTTTTRAEKRLEVASVTNDQVCGKDECVRAVEVESVARREFSAGRTVSLVLAIALIVAIGASMPFGFPAGY